MDDLRKANFSVAAERFSQAFEAYFGDLQPPAPSQPKFREAYLAKRVHALALA
jgi:hypothetical protein